MYKILTLNAISPVYHDHLSDDQYEVSSNMENPDAIIVRSANMHGMELPQSLKAIARAGAGFNNIPVDACTKQGIVVFNTPGANANAVKELAAQPCSWAAGILREASNGSRPWRTRETRCPSWWKRAKNASPARN